MTTEQAIRILAERDGWGVISNLGKRWRAFSPEGVASKPIESEEEALNRVVKMNGQYATSLNAIQRVVLKLTKEELAALRQNIRKDFFTSSPCFSLVIYALTLPATQLCLYVAEAIEACKEKGKQ